MEGERGAVVIPAPEILAAVAIVTILTLRGRDPVLIPARVRALGLFLTLDLRKGLGDAPTPVV
jgi:hypothetical protein